MRSLLVLFLLTVPAFAGCTFFADGGVRPAVTVLEEGFDANGDPNWNQDNALIIQINESKGHSVRILAESLQGDPTVESTSPATAATPNGYGGFENQAKLVLPDGIWEVSYFVDDDRRAHFENVYLDLTPPAILGLVKIGNAPDGMFTLGQGAATDADATLRIVDQASGAYLGGALPLPLEGLGDGIHVYDLHLEDPAGNLAVYTVQVLVGDATELPEGQYTAGVVARYANQLKIWSLDNLDAYASIPAAAAGIGGAWLGEGFGITPNDSEVRRIAAAEVDADMNSMEAAIALYRWLFDELEYDETRLESQGLMLPRDVILDSEHRWGNDTDGDGLVDSGAGNGEHGGVCRDLAGTFVSLLRAAGIPARLVTGYLGGGVNGFHAWVEFYAPAAGLDQPDWVPVDVSPIDGLWDDGPGLTTGETAFLTSFAIRLPDYLASRTVPDGKETGGWSTALGYVAMHPQGSPPAIRFENELTTERPVYRTLCVHSESWERSISGGNCPGATHFFQNFPVSIIQTIDYGFEIGNARGASIDLEASYPCRAEAICNATDALVDDVQYLHYGAAWTADPDTGKLRATVSR